jgi:hypothetical protein
VVLNLGTMITLDHIRASFSVVNLLSRFLGGCKMVDEEYYQFITMTEEYSTHLQITNIKTYS